MRAISFGLMGGLLGVAAAPHARGRERALIHRELQSSTRSVTYSAPTPGKTSSTSVTTVSGSSAAASVSSATSASTITWSSSTASTSTTSSASAAQSYTPPSVSLPSITPNAQITSASYARLTDLLPSVMQNAISISTHSWELGTLCNALVELYYPSLSPFAYDGPEESKSANELPKAMLEVLVNAMGSYDWTGSPSSFNLTTSNDASVYLSSTTAPVALQPQPLVDGNGALGDPASLGAAAYIAAQLIDSLNTTIDGARSGADYAWAVGNQLSYLQSGTTSDNGKSLLPPKQRTISQRDGYFELWADMGYMIPPFPTYLGLAASDDTLLQLGLDQWLLESSALLDTDQNLFRHVNDWDARFWVTGNGWMLLGLMRVLASIDAAGKTESFSTEITTAKQQAALVFNSLWQQLDSDNLIPDYMLQSNTTLAIGDVAGTAAIVAAYYRFHVLCPEYAVDILTQGAETAWEGVMAKVGDDGWATHVVDPLGTYGWVVYPDDPTLHSPEAQSFVGMMWAARTAAGV